VSTTIKVKTTSGDVLFEFAPDGVFVYTSHCGGGRIRRRKAKRLRHALDAWLAQPQPRPPHGKAAP
jgi:hypothetical protein